MLRLEITCTYIYSQNGIGLTPECVVLSVGEAGVAEWWALLRCVEAGFSFKFIRLCSSKQCWNEVAVT